MRVREPLINYFSKHTFPVTVRELLDTYPVNKTTIYRELEFLKNENIIREVVFDDGIKRYESTQLDHHHHLVCIKCHNVSDVELNEDFENQEKKILKTQNFRVINHSLEFFGICVNCG